MYRMYTFVYILECIELYTNVSLQECIEILKYFLNNEGVREREEVGGQSEGKSAVPGQLSQVQLSTILNRVLFRKPENKSLRVWVTKAFCPYTRQTYSREFFHTKDFK